MKVLIINPPPVQGVKFVREGRCEQRASSFQYSMVPISLPSIAALLRNRGFEVNIIDANALGLSVKLLAKITSEFAPSLIVVNFSTATFYSDRDCVIALRSVNSGHITAIGNHVTALPGQSLEDTLLDSVIRGEPEMVCLELSQCIERNGDLSEIKGISYHEEDTVWHNDPAPPIEELDTLPFPARDLLDNSKYILPIVNAPYTLLISSRGCPNRCIYCTACQYYGKRLRRRSPANIVEEIKEITGRFGLQYITMWSDTFTLNRQFVINVCEAIISNSIKVKWMCNGRVDQVDTELLDLMKKSGCIGISYGIESGVQEILDRANKGTTLENICNAVKWTKQAGIQTLAHIIFGLPGETPETIEKTIQFTIELNPDYAQFYCAVPFPGTSLYEMALEKGWLTTHDWSAFEINQAIISTDTITADQIRRGRISAYRRFYLRPCYLMNRLYKIRSFSELIITVKQTIDFIKGWIF